MDTMKARVLLQQETQATHLVTVMLRSLIPNKMIHWYALHTPFLPQTQDAPSKSELVRVSLRRILRSIGKRNVHSTVSSVHTRWSELVVWIRMPKVVARHRGQMIPLCTLFCGRTVSDTLYVFEMLHNSTEIGVSHNRCGKHAVSTINRDADSLQPCQQQASC